MIEARQQSCGPGVGLAERLDAVHVLNAETQPHLACGPNAPPAAANGSVNTKRRALPVLNPR